MCLVDLIGKWSIGFDDDDKLGAIKIYSLEVYKGAIDYNDEWGDSIIPYQVHGFSTRKLYPHYKTKKECQEAIKSLKPWNTGYKLSVSEYGSFQNAVENLITVAR